MIIIIKLNAVPYCTLAVFVVLHFSLLRYFPSTNLVDRVDNCYTSLYFSFSTFLYLFNLEFQNLLLSLPSVLSCVLLYSPSFSSYSFYSSLCSLFCFLPPFIHFIPSCSIYGWTIHLNLEMEPKYLTKSEVQLNLDILRTKNDKRIL